jgi:L-methionine (R)-S-oxide reductase
VRPTVLLVLFSANSCVPILDDARQVIGIVDAEAKAKGFFGAERLVVVAALAVVAPAVLP